jgi:hypothetical protein
VADAVIAVAAAMREKWRTGVGFGLTVVMMRDTIRKKVGRVAPADKPRREMLCRKENRYA